MKSTVSGTMIAPLAKITSISRSQMMMRKKTYFGTTPHVIHNKRQFSQTGHPLSIFQASRKYITPVTFTQQGVNNDIDWSIGNVSIFLIQ